jgi:MFS family permease
MVTEAVVAPFYAPIGDKYGRRPVILLLTAFWGIFAMAFGLSKSVLVAVFLRGCRRYPLHIASSIADPQWVYLPEWGS